MHKNTSKSVINLKIYQSKKFQNQRIKEFKRMRQIVHNFRMNVT